MKKGNPDHSLEFLAAFDGRKHHYPGGYFIKFEIKRIEPSPARPHGLRYSFTLHGPDGKRRVGFDNAHAAPRPRGRYRQKPDAADHWHRSAGDRGRPYRFVDAAQLVEDFFNEAERVL